MQGIDVHIDTNIGKTLSALGSTLTTLTGEEDEEFYFGDEPDGRHDVSLEDVSIIQVGFLFCFFKTFMDILTLLYFCFDAEKRFTHLFNELSHRMTKPSKWHVRPVKTQISLGIRPVWSESSLSAWKNIGSSATHWVHSEDSDQTGDNNW